MHLVDDRLSINNVCNEINYSMVLKVSLGALAFSCNMLLNVPLIAGRQTITHNREALVNDALLKNNQKHINCDYYVGQSVLNHNNLIKGKLTIKTSCPFEIVCVHMNGTITIQLPVNVTE